MSTAAKINSKSVVHQTISDNIETQDNSWRTRIVKHLTAQHNPINALSHSKFVERTEYVKGVPVKVKDEYRHVPTTYCSVTTLKVEPVKNNFFLELFPPSEENAQANQHNKIPVTTSMPDLNDD